MPSSLLRDQKTDALFLEQFCSDSGCAIRVRCSSGRMVGPRAQRFASSKKDSHGKGDQVLRSDDFPETLEMVLAAATRKDYRVWHANKEIRLNSEVHGSHVASEASSLLVQELGGRVSMRL